MPQAIIEVNAAAGSDNDVPIDTLVQLSNDDVGDETTYDWTIVDQPDGAADALSSTTIENPTFTPKKEGTYVINLIVDQGLPTEDTDQVIIGVRELKTRHRIPGATETIEDDSAKGWRLTQNELLKNIDGLFADPAIVVAEAGAAGITASKVLQVSDVATIKSTLPGEEEVPEVTIAPATLEANLRGRLLVMLEKVGGGAPALGELLRARAWGLLAASFAGAPAVGDLVFVDDSADISLTPGTVSRPVGIVVKSGGGFFRVWFDGTQANFTAGTITEGGDTIITGGTLQSAIQELAEQKHVGIDHVFGVHDFSSADSFAYDVGLRGFVSIITGDFAFGWWAMQGSHKVFEIEAHIEDTAPTSKVTARLKTLNMATNTLSGVLDTQVSDGSGTVQTFTFSFTAFTLGADEIVFIEFENTDVGGSARFLRGGRVKARRLA
jgi:PKD repeat protein